MKTAVIGAGAWGTALATLLCRNGHDTTLWCRTPERAEEMAATRVNSRLPQAALPEGLKFSPTLTRMPSWSPSPRALRRARCCA